MNLYLTVGTDRLRIPLLPDKLSVKHGTTSISFQIIKIGEHKIPRGTSVTGYSWSGVFPGKNMSSLGFVHDWQKPNDIVKKLREWQASGAIIDLMLTDSCIKDQVFIDSFTYNYQEMDNIAYTLNLTAYRKLTVTTAPPQPKIKIPVEQVQQQVVQPQQQKPYRPPTPPKDDGKGDEEKPTLSFQIPTSQIAGAIVTGVKVAATAISVISTVSKLFGGG